MKRIIVDAGRAIWRWPADRPAEVMRKSDYRFDSEPVGEEGGAWLRGTAEPEVGKSYAQTAGLCLPHLRRAIAITKDEPAVCCLAEKAVAQLNPLRSDLGETARTDNWSHLAEPLHLWEQASRLRAVACFSGEAPRADEGSVTRLRRKALTDHQS